MRVAILTDTHHGGKNDNVSFASYQRRFYRDTFFPLLEREKITTVLHLGDVFDRRKYCNHHSLHLAKEMFFDPAYEMGLKIHMLVGNHDAYYKNDNFVNTPSLVLGEYDNITIYPSLPEVINLDGADILMIPWIAPNHYAEALEIIKTAKADIAMGHLEVNGHEIMPGYLCEHGLDASLFQRYERVFCGHYHGQQDNGHVRYLGAPYEITWNDYNTAKGFHIYDTSTREFEFYQNPNHLFKKIFYDDTKDDDPLDMDLSNFCDSYVKIFVIQKTDFYAFDKFVDRCYNEGNFFELKIVEDFSDLDPNSIADEELEDVEDTLTLLEKYVGEIDSKLLDKNKLNRLLKGLYVEANEVE